MARMTATETAQRFIELAVQMFGGRDFRRGEIVETCTGKIWALRIYEGATEQRRPLSLHAGGDRRGRRSFLVARRRLIRREPAGARLSRLAGKDGQVMLEGIGSTEMLHIFVTSRFGESRPACTGKPVKGYEARIVDDQMNEAAVGANFLVGGRFLVEEASLAATRSMRRFHLASPSPGWARLFFRPRGAANLKTLRDLPLIPQPIPTRHAAAMNASRNSFPTRAAPSGVRLQQPKRSAPRSVPKDW